MGQPVSSNSVLVQGSASVLRLTQQSCSEGRERSEPANHLQADDLQLTRSNSAGQEKQDITAAQLPGSITSSTYLLGDSQGTDYWRWVREQKS